MADWTSVDGAAKDEKGNYIALVKGQWVPASAAGKSDDGKYVAILANPPKTETAKDKLNKATGGAIDKPNHPLQDLAESTGAAIGEGASALGEMFERPIAAGVNAITGKDTKTGMSGDEWAQVGQKFKRTAEAKNPIARTGGQVIAGLMETAAIPEAKIAQAARGLLPTIGKAAAGGAMYGLATEPTDPNSPESYPAQKMNQAERGAAFGAGAAGLGEGMRAGENAVKGTLFGKQSNQARAFWDEVKDRGFSIRPEQTREDSAKVSQAGLTQADKIKNANKSADWVAEATGIPPTIDRVSGDHRLDAKWFKDNFKTLGDEYEKVYKPGTSLSVDKDSLVQLSDMVSQQMKAGQPFMSTRAVAAANKLIVDAEAAGVKFKPDPITGQISAGGPDKVSIDAKLIQDLRNNLNFSRSLSTNPMQAHAMTEVIDAIDGSVERNHPELAAILKDVRPKYQALKTLEYGAMNGDFVDSGGSVDLEGLGKYIRETDPHYIRGDSNHPLARQGLAGEALGIRAISKPSVVEGGSRGSGSGAEQVTPTKANMWRLGLQQIKRPAPVRAAAEDYLKSGKLDVPAQNSTPYALTGAIFGKDDADDAKETAKRVKVRMLDWKAKHDEASAR